MDHNLQIWVTAGCIALIVSALVQVCTAMVFFRLLSFLRPSPGGPTPPELVDKVLKTVVALDQAAKSAAEMLAQLKPVVEQVSTVSQRQLDHADQVVGDVLNTVERVNHNVNSAINRPFREVHALSAAVRSAATVLFKTNDNSDKGKRC